MSDATGESPALSPVLQAALEGQGVAIGWRHIVQPLLEQQQLLKPLDTSIQTDNPFFIIAPLDKPLSAQAAALRDWLIDEMQQS